MVDPFLSGQKRGKGRKEKLRSLNRSFVRQRDSSRGLILSYNKMELYGYYVENKPNHSPVKLCPWVTNQMTKNCCRALQLNLVRKMPIPSIMSGWSFLLDSSNHYGEVDRTLYQRTMGWSAREIKRHDDYSAHHPLLHKSENTKPHHR